MSHNRTHPQVGDQVQITVGLDKGKRFTVIGGYSDQVELGDENGKFVRSASAVICTVCLPPVANTTGESLAALAGGGQGEGNFLDKRFKPGGVWANIPQVCPCCGSTEIHPACHTPPDPVSFCDSCSAEFCVEGKPGISPQHGSAA